MPRVNVDGAAAGHRMLSSGADPNRDHLLLSQPEIRALHLAMQALPPDVVFDHHEFAVGWPWLAKFGGLQAPDVMILEAINPPIPKAMTRIERELYRPALEAAIEAHGLMPHDYVTTGAVPADRRVWLGGTAPGVARNTFGLRGSVSYLIETRGIGIGLQDYQRRVATHYLLARAVLETTAEDPDGLLRRLAEARADAASDHSALIVAHRKVSARDHEQPRIDQPRPVGTRAGAPRDHRCPGRRPVRADGAARGRHSGRCPRARVARQLLGRRRHSNGADETNAPVYRVMDGTRLALTPRPGAPSASAALCGGH